MVFITKALVKKYKKKYCALLLMFAYSCEQEQE